MKWLQLLKANWQSFVNPLKLKLTMKFIILCVEAEEMLSFYSPGKSLSMGYGFVQYHKAEAAQKALRQLQVDLYPSIKCMFVCCFLANACSFPQHCSVDGHQLQLKISERATR